MHILGPGFILGRFFLLFRIKLQVKLQLALKGNALNLKIYKPSGRGGRAATKAKDQIGKHPNLSLFLKRFL